MQKANKILALFFLGIFSLLLLHQAIPHWHHQHQEQTHHHDVAHTHNKHHHHKPEKSNSKKGFFDWFLEMHSHTSTVSDILVLKQAKVKKVVVENELASTVLTKIVDLIFVESDAFIEEWYHPPDLLQKIYLPNYTLRGPPNLG